MKCLKLGASACVFAVTAMIGLDAAAASIRVTCEVRNNRSKISVDGKDLPAGSYMTQALSGLSSASSPLVQASGGEVEADYDSNSNDIREGAVAISSSFIARQPGAQVTGKILNATGNTIISDTSACRVRTR
jgi:hypothetical protein